MNSSTAHTTSADHGHISITIDGITWQPDDYSADTWYVNHTTNICGIVQFDTEGWYYSVKDWSSSQSTSYGQQIRNLFDALGEATHHVKTLYNATL